VLGFLLPGGPKADAGPSAGPVPYADEAAARQARLDSAVAQANITRASGQSLVLIRPEDQRALDEVSAVMEDLALREASAGGDRARVREIELARLRRRYEELGLPSDMVDSLIGREADLMLAGANVTATSQAAGGYGRAGVAAIGETTGAEIKGVRDEIRAFFQWFRSSGFGTFQ
jgi:hypothetical protein